LLILKQSKMAFFAIGDIHGCFTALKKVVEVSEIKTSDTIIFLGDYIDRGPQSKQIIDWIIELGKKYSVIALRGNHELMMLNSRYNGHSLSNWLYNGGAQTLDSYNIGDDMGWHLKIPDEHWAFFEATQKYYEVENFICVHAGLTPGVELEEQTEGSIFWEHRHEPVLYKKGKIVVCGHTPQRSGKIGNFGHTLMVDTFAFGGQWLTCLNLSTGAFCQANQKGEVNKGQCPIG